MELVYTKIDNETLKVTYQIKKTDILAERQALLDKQIARIQKATNEATAEEESKNATTFEYYDDILNKFK